MVNQSEGEVWALVCLVIIFFFFQTQELSQAENMTVDDVAELFQQIFSKTLSKVSVNEVFSEEWDSYRKVSSW